MIDYDAKYLAQAAEDLLRNKVLRDAIASMRSDALEELARADAAFTPAIQGMQARIWVCDEFLDTLKRHIEALPSDD